MENRKKGNYIGILGALMVHVAVIALLILVSFTIPEQPGESGVSIMLGDTETAQGGFDPSSLVDVDVLPEALSDVEPETSEQELITQTEEETVVIPPRTEPVKEVKPEKTAEEKAAEAKRLAEEKAERARKAAAEEASRRVSGAFGRGAEMGNRGDNTGEGAKGNPMGNSTSGATTGSAGYGTFDLGGRSIGEGGLPRPVYNVQEEGKVVITITVNPGGNVIATSINRQTNTVNPTLRRAAEEAARKARFNSVNGVNNQTGTITYFFNLK